MNTESSCLAIIGDSLDEIVIPGLRQAHGTDGTREVCALLVSAILLKIKIKFGKINIAVKVFQKTIICLWMCWVFSTRQ